jgi:uncharacterized integral membrane protein
MVTENSNQLQTASSAPAEAIMTATPAVARPVRGPLQLRRTRVGGLWVVVVVFALVLLLLLNFVLQNGQRSDLYYLGAHGSLPMGAALLLSAVFGALLVTLPAAVQIAQLRLVTVRRGDGTMAKQHLTIARMSVDSEAPGR